MCQNPTPIDRPAISYVGTLHGLDHSIGPRLPDWRWQEVRFDPLQLGYYLSRESHRSPHYE
jgi:hypothetical protein